MVVILEFYGLMKALKAPGKKVHTGTNDCLSSSRSIINGPDQTSSYLVWPDLAQIKHDPTLCCHTLPKSNIILPSVVRPGPIQTSSNLVRPDLAQIRHHLTWSGQTWPSFNIIQPCVARPCPNQTSSSLVWPDQAYIKHHRT